MAISLYDFSVPLLIRGLTNLSAILDKAASHAEAKKFDATALAQARSSFTGTAAQMLLEFVAQSKRGVCTPRGQTGDDGNTLADERDRL